MYKLVALLSLLLVSNHVSASAVMVDTPAFKDSSAEHNNKSSKNGSKSPKKQNSGKQNNKKQGSKKQRAAVDYSRIEFAANPFNSEMPAQNEHYYKFRKQHDEISTETQWMPQRDSDHKPKHIDFDEFKRDHRDDDDHDFGWGFHDRKHDYFDDKFEYGHCDKPDTNPVPLPAAAWLFMSGLVGLVRMGHRRKK